VELRKPKPIADPLFGEYGMTVIGAQTLVLRAEDPSDVSTLISSTGRFVGYCFNVPACNGKQASSNRCPVFVFGRLILVWAWCRIAVRSGTAAINPPLRWRRFKES